MTSHETPPIVIVLLVALAVAAAGVYLTRDGDSRGNGNRGVRSLEANLIERDLPAGMAPRTSKEATPTATPEPTPSATPSPTETPRELESIEIAMNEAPGEIRGWTVDHGGQPMPDVEVKLRFENLVEGGMAGPDLNLKSGPAGLVHFAEVPPGSWTAVADHPSYATATLPGIAVQAGEVTEGIELVLEPALKLSGKVQTNSGIALENAEVVLASQKIIVPGAGKEVIKREVPYRKGTTNASGEFSFDRVAPGPAVLIVTLQGFASERIEFDMEAENREGMTVTLVPSASIGGIVRTRTNAPVEGANVELSDPRDASVKKSVKTNPDGSFLIGGLRAERTYVLKASAKNFAPAGPIEVPAGRLETLIVLEAGGAISGLVTSLSTGGTVADILVSLNTAQGALTLERTVATASDGTYRFADLPTGTYNVRVQSDRLTSEPRLGVSVSIPKETGGVNFVVYPGKTIAGTVEDSVTGERIKSAKVSISSRVGPDFLSSQKSSTTTDEGGTFKVENLPHGLYDLSATAEGYLQYPGPEGRAEVRLLPGEIPEPVVLLLARGGIVTGMVRDSKGTAVSGAEVRLYDTPGKPGRIKKDHFRAVTDGSGSYEISGIPLEGEVNITAYANVVGSTIPFDSSNEEEREYALYGRAVGRSNPVVLTEFLSSARADISLGVGGPLTVRVRANTGEPLPEANVSIGHNSFPGGITPSNWRGKTGPMGTITFPSVPEGNGGAGASKSGYISSGTGYSIQDGEPTEVEITLIKGTTIKGRVLDDLGQPVSEGYVQAWGESGSPGGGRGNLDARGFFEIDGVGQGTYRLRANAQRQTGNGKWTVLGEISGFPTGGGEATIVVPMNGALGGEVIDADTGKPIPGASVTIEGHYEYRPGARTRFRETAHAKTEPGVFQLNSIPPATYRMWINAGGYLGTTMEGIEVRSPGDRWVGQIALERGASLKVKVVDADTGEPINGVRVQLDPGGASTKTNNRGDAHLGGLEAGIYNLRFSHGQYLDAEKALVQVPENGEGDAGVVEMEKGGVLSGKVLDSSNDAVANALVSLRYVGEERKRSARTNNSGIVKMEGLEPGGVVVTVTAQFPRGSMTKSIELSISRFEETVFEMRLAGNLSIEGPISSAQGQTLRGKSIEIYPLEPDGTPVTSGRIIPSIRGDYYSAENMIEGGYLLLASAAINGEPVHWHVSAWVDRDPTVVSLHPPRGTLHGRVLDAETGQPEPDYTIRLRNLSSPQSSVASLRSWWEWNEQSDEIGYYEFNNLPPGTYEIVATPPGSATPILDILTLQPGFGSFAYDLIDDQ